MSGPREYRVIARSTALSPITHAMGTAGNESLVMREPVVTPRGVRMVPCLSGNAIRHRMVREPGAEWLMRAYGLHGILSLRELYFLFNGGTLTDGGGREDTRRIADFHRLFPLGRLIGGCLPDQILSGTIQVHRGTLACRENTSRMRAMIGPGADVPEFDGLRPAESFVSGYQYTRASAVKTHADSIREDDRNGGDEARSGLMIFSGQAVMAGSTFLHGFVIQRGSTLEFGALMLSLSMWVASGGTVGGMAARGHGRLDLAVVSLPDPDLPDINDSIGAYVDHAIASKDEAVGWLKTNLAPRVRPEKKGGKGRVSIPSGLIPDEVVTDGD